MDTRLSRLAEAIDKATRGMDDHQLGRHPEGKWSTAEVLEHLSLTYSGTAKGLERCLHGGVAPLGPPSLKQRLSTAVVLGIGYLPSGREAPKGTRPHGRPAQTVMTEVTRNLATMDEMIAKSEARYGSRTRVLNHPILGPLTASQWRKFHFVHGKHHLKQILRLRQSS